MFIQYPDALKKTTDKYTYFTDDGSKIVLHCGENGVTPEIIAALRESHIAELQSDHRAKHYIRDGKQWKAAVFSIDGLNVSEDGVLSVLADFTYDPSSILDREHHTQDILQRYDELMNSLTEEQRELFIKVRIQHVPQNDIMREKGVSHQAITNRMLKIDKKIKKIFKEGVAFWGFCDYRV